MPPAGFEPAPRGLKGRRSNQLSYRWRRLSPVTEPSARPSTIGAAGTLIHAAGWYCRPGGCARGEPSPSRAASFTTTQTAVTVIVAAGGSIPRSSRWPSRPVRRGLGPLSLTEPSFLVAQRCSAADRSSCPQEQLAVTVAEPLPVGCAAPLARLVLHAREDAALTPVRVFSLICLPVREFGLIRLARDRLRLDPVARQRARLDLLAADLPGRVDGAAQRDEERQAGDDVGKKVSAPGGIRTRAARLKRPPL